MSNETKQVVQQLPGHNFRSGSVTLFEIAESQGKNIGSRGSIPADAVVEDKYKDTLAKAIPVDKIEDVLRKNSEKKVEVPARHIGKSHTVKKVAIHRGLKMLYKGKLKVVVIHPDADFVGGNFLHLILVTEGELKGKKFKVPESKLEVISG